MPSSEKTNHLQLNKWLGEDKPKREDFNADNSRVDGAVGELAGRCGRLEEEGEALGSRCGRLETAQISLAEAAAGLERQCGELESGQRGLKDEIDGHVQSGGHITQDERTGWNSNIFRVGTYRGTGTEELVVSVGYRPLNGYLYAVDKPMVGKVGEELHLYSGFFGAPGCTKGIELGERGFTVRHSMSAGADGVAMKYNEAGTTYVYLLRMI